MNARITILIAAFALVAACSETSGTTTPPPGNPTPDVVNPTPDTTTPDTHTEPTGPNKLWFAVATGVDGQPCVNTCALKATAGTALPLQVFYRDSLGNGIGGANLSYKVNTIASVASLTSEIVSTNPQGTGQGILNIAANAEGTATVTVTALNDAQAGALTFNVQLGEVTLNALTVTINYAGSSENIFEARLFLQNSATQAPTCGDVDPSNIAAPVSILKKSALTNQAKATWTNKELPGLMTAGSQLYTVQVVAPGGTLPPRAHGCLDGIPVKANENREIVVDVNDMPNKFQGNYDLMTHMDMHNNLPGDLGMSIGLIIDLFTDPGAVALVLACQNASGLLGTLCSQLVSGGQTTALGDLAAQEINKAFFQFITDNLGSDGLITGQTIALLLKDIRFRSTLTVNGEPAIPVKGENDVITRVDFPTDTVSEEWAFVGYFWKIGKNCAPTDIECGLEWVKMSDIYGANPMVINMAAGIVDDTQLEIDPHEVSLLSYGPLVNFLIEKKVLPLIFGDGSNGLAKIDSYEQVVLGMLGGPGCLLQPKAQQIQACCNSFYANVSPTLGLPAIIDALIPSLCTQLVPAVTSELQGVLSDVTGPLVIGTPEGSGCTMTDWDDDLWMDHLGSETAHCNWDAHFDLNSDPFSPDATFYGTRK